MSREILAGLVERPNLQDTFEGLASWWLIERDLRRRLHVVREATDYLVERSFLEATRRADGQVYYRLNTARLREIETFLSQEGREEEP